MARFELEAAAAWARVVATGVAHLLLAQRDEVPRGEDALARLVVQFDPEVFEDQPDGVVEAQNELNKARSSMSRRGAYRRDRSGAYVSDHIVVLTLREERIDALDAFHDPTAHERFALPARS